MPIDAAREALRRVSHLTTVPAHSIQEFTEDLTENFKHAQEKEWPYE